jgi:hypothetical protein
MGIALDQRVEYGSHGATCFQSLTLCRSCRSMKSWLHSPHALITRTTGKKDKISPKFFHANQECLYVLISVGLSGPAAALRIGRAVSCMTELLRRFLCYCGLCGIQFQTERVHVGSQIGRVLTESARRAHVVQPVPAVSASIPSCGEAHRRAG